ncbi:Hypothetical protein A7982_07490 [Minicystis rosea]|nr:Hypothetical protein A7982_07490 [Minicystis rosea]
MISAGSLCPDTRATPPGPTQIPEPGARDLREREAESIYVEAVRP